MFKRHASRLLALCAPALVALLMAAPTSAFTQSPQWTVTSFTIPTNLPPTPGSKGTYRVYVQNTGDAPSDGSPVTITDTLPAGLKLTSGAEVTGVKTEEGYALSCAGLTCTYAAVAGNEGHSGVVGIDNILELKIPVEVQAGAPSSVTNIVTVTGGGAPEASRETLTRISAAPVPFGISPGSEAVALSSSQAGAHPDVTNTFAFTSNAGGLLAGNPREAGTTLPPGFVGDLVNTPKCPLARFSEQGGNGDLDCPMTSIIGTVTLYLTFGELRVPIVQPLVNLATNPGEIARWGFNILGLGIEGTVSLHPPDYAVRANFEKIADSSLAFDGVSLTVWGVPPDHSHDLMRDYTGGGGEGDYLYETPAEEVEGHQKYGEEGNYRIAAKLLPNGRSVTTAPIPYSTSPTQCTGQPSQATMEVDSWEEPEHLVSVPVDVAPFTGCSLLEFAPGLKVSPDTTNADTPAGLTFGVKMNQEGLVEEEESSEAAIRNTIVTLPEGMGINPGQANGLGACQESEEELDVEAPPKCPSNSKVGEVEIETPGLRNKIDGNVYVLQSNPPHLKLLVAPEDPENGIYVKFVGEVSLNETTGQLVTTFAHTPALPFSSLKFTFSGGAQAALTTPTSCGVYTTTTDFSPWSSPFTSDVFPSGSFAIEDGTDGGPCPPSPLPFSPSLDAGATTDQAGGFTDFSTLLTRSDDQQRIATLQFSTPEGLLGEIAKVPLCSEADAQADACPEASQIGHTVVEAGPGPYPLVVPQPGRPPAPIYLTGAYKGAPFGLLIKVPLVVGPFVLETQVVRAKIEVDPLTSRLTITTDRLPTYVDGVPADLRAINATIDRPEFMFNPTSCNPMSFAGTATSTEGVAMPISTHFQMGSCRSLLFKPNFQVSTSAKTSKADGASLDARIVYPTGPLGANQASSQSNINRIKVELPKALPSRLTTLQKACSVAVFDANAAACPPDSRVGLARAITPVLPVPLTGPAFFVSNGSAKFPELVIMLQGYGVTVELRGETFISTKGITSSTFSAVPDVPIASFELYLPEGPYSALSANGNLCKLKLVMPTFFTGQNGAELNQDTPIKVTGCAKAKKTGKAKGARKSSSARGSRRARGASRARKAGHDRSGDRRGE